MEEDLSTNKENKVTKENIQKFDEEYKENKKIPKDYKKKIINRIFKNILIAVIIIGYLIAINILSLHIETKQYIIGIKIICILLALVSVVYFELSYKKNSGYLFVHGAEFLVLATITLFSVYAYKIYFITYNDILLYIAIIVTIYYIIKTVCTINNMKKQYYKSQNDIREIITKGTKHK